MLINAAIIYAGALIFSLILVVALFLEIYFE